MWANDNEIKRSKPQMESLMKGAKIIQNAYVVDNLEEAMERWTKLYGIGPWVILPHVIGQNLTYRGEPSELDFSAGFVQTGEINIELIEQHTEGPSAFRDMFAPGEEGFHHVAIISDDYEGDKARFEAAGCPVATEFSSGPDSGIAFIDTRKLLGHMVELYQNEAAINGLYSVIRQAAENWDGETLIATS
jgi:hypothetical protein